MTSCLQIVEALEAAERVIRKASIAPLGLHQLPEQQNRLLFVANCIRRYLTGEERTLDHAFGLKKGRGEYERPYDDKLLQKVEKAIPLLLSGKSFKVTAELLGFEQKQFKDIYNRYLPIAVERLIDIDARGQS